MDTSQSQSSKVLNTLGEKMDELMHIISNDDGTIDETKIRKAMYQQYRKIEQIMQLVDGQVIYDWDEYFMGVACLAALRSKDPRTPVGACIVTADNTIVGIGYNSMPFTKDGKNDHHFPWKASKNFQISKLDLDKKYSSVVHAAVNAIANRTMPNLEGCTIYLTHYLDEDCAHAIIQSGISHVKYGMFTRHQDTTKIEDIKYAAELLRLGKVCYSHFETLREPHVTVIPAPENDIQVSLSKRIEKARNTTTSEPEKDLILTWEQFFMSLAMLSTKKQGRHERHPEFTQGACIISEENKQVISVGFSGYPESMDRRAVQKGIGNMRDHYSEDIYMCHAEYDAILSKGTPPVKGYTLYVTKYPCNMCAKLIVQSGIKEVVYFEKGEIDIRYDKGKMYVASRRILAAALPPKEEDSIKKTAREVIELMVTGINNIVDATAGGTDMMVKETFQRILEATPPPKEEDSIKEIATEVIKLMIRGIKNIVDLTAGETDNTNKVKRAFHEILNVSLEPKETDSIEEKVREVIELMKSGIDNIVTGGTDIDVVKAFQIVLDSALPPMKEVRRFEKVKDLELQKVSFKDLKVNENGSTENTTHTEA